MSDSQAEQSTAREQSGSERSELRTVGFRLREIQRLLAVRVEQENRRLAAEGLDPVEESRFVAEDDRRD